VLKFLFPERFTYNRPVIKEKVYWDMWMLCETQFWQKAWIANTNKLYFQKILKIREYLYNFVIAKRILSYFFMNTLAYIFYLFITYFITVRTGLLFYRNGRVYILTLLQGDGQLTDFINKMLLTGYYLLNLGYAATMIRFWKTIATFTELLTSIATMTGTIMLTLAVIHFINMTAIYFISKRNNHLHHTT